MKQLTKVLLFLTISAAISQQVTAQKLKKGIVTIFDMKSIVEANNFVWYGWDFSHSRMNDYAKAMEGELIVTKYIPGMCERLNKRFPPEKVKDHLRKENVKYDLVSVQKLYKQLDPDQFIISDEYSISIAELKDIIQAYELPQNDGIGFVINVEQMNKPDRYVTGYATFFDIKTKEILWTTKMKGYPGSKYGFTMYWAEGVSEIYAYFIGDYYNQSMKAYKKEHGLK